MKQIYRWNGQQWAEVRSAGQRLIDFLYASANTAPYNFAMPVSPGMSQLRSVIDADSCTLEQWAAGVEQLVDEVQHHAR
jgi:hypothetical protein